MAKKASNTKAPTRTNGARASTAPAGSPKATGSKKARADAATSRKSTPPVVTQPATSKRAQPANKNSAQHNRRAHEAPRTSRPAPATARAMKPSNDGQRTREFEVEVPVGIGRSVVDFATTHAGPLTVFGAGVGWLLAGLSRPRKRTPDVQPSQAPYTGSVTVDQVRARAEHLAAQAAHALQDGRDRVLDGAHALEERVAARAHELGAHLAQDASRLGGEASRLGHQVGDRVGRAGRRAADLAEEHPLATGLMVLAAGVAAAALMPSTRSENKWLGVPRDRLMKRAQRSLNDIKDKALEGTEELREVLSEFTRAAE